MIGLMSIWRERKSAEVGPTGPHVEGKLDPTL